MTMDFSTLEQYFYNGELDTCINQGEKFLLENPEDIDVLFLMAVAYHDIVYYDGHEVVYTAIEHYTIPYLRRILAIDPNHGQTLYNILSYPLTNQYNLWNIARPKLHITEENKSEFIRYAEQLKKIEGYEVYGYDFIRKIHEGLDDVAEQLVANEQAIAFNESFFFDQREARDKNTSISFMKKIYILDQNTEYEKKKIVSLIAAKIPTFVSREEYAYIDLAEIVFEQGDTDLAVQILIQLLDANQSSSFIIEEFAKWHKRLSDLMQNGYKSDNALYFVLMIERNYYSDLNLPNDTYYHHALEYVTREPKLYFIPHFIGTYLFENEQYEQALPYLEQALQLNPIATTYCRALQCQLHLERELNTEVPVFTSMPLELYGCGVEIDDLIHAYEHAPTKSALHFIRQQIYLQAHQAFDAYFNQNKYFSLYACDLHHWAMNCNNLALAHISMGDFESAVEIADLGLHYSTFWEIVFTLLEACVLAENYTLAQKTIDYYYSSCPAECVPDLKHLIFEARKIKVHYELGQSEDIHTDIDGLLSTLYNFAPNPNELSEYDLRDLEAAKSIVQSVLYTVLERTDNEEKLAFYQDHAANYPLEANPQFMIMQITNELEQYAWCASAAQAYLRNKPAFLLDELDKAKVIYLLVKSHLKDQNYTEASSAFDQHHQEMATILTEGDLFAWLNNGLITKINMGQLDEVKRIEEAINALYKAENWLYDKPLETTKLALAEMHYKLGNLKIAHQYLDQILQYSDADEQAKQFKSSWKKPSFLSKLGF